jgi:hypothetical protein
MDGFELGQECIDKASMKNKFKTYLSFGKTPFVAKELPSPPSPEGRLKLNLLGGIITLGSSTAGGITQCCSGVHPFTPSLYSLIAKLSDAVERR